MNAIFALGIANVLGIATGGTWTVSFDGDETTPIPFDDDGTETTSAMEALPGIGAGNVAVVNAAIGGDGSLVDPGMYAEFQGALGAQPIAEERLTADGSGLTGPDADYAIIVAVDTIGSASADPSLAWAAP